jgi:hypothetical protein
MKVIGRIILYGSLVVSLFFYWQMFILTPCDKLVRYDIGQFDEGFGINPDQLLTQIQRAELVWEEAAGKDLFRYTPGADFKVNLIFTEQQQQRKESTSLERQLDSQERSLEATQTRYEQTLDRYRQAVHQFEHMKSDYERDVAYWNQQGGAPEAQYQDLERRRQQLNTKRQEVNNLVTLLNQLAEQSNQQVETFNTSVGHYHDTFHHHGEEFTAGDTDGSEINLYSFANLAQLRVLLIHEFGHVLGIGHVEDPTSVMHYLLGDQNGRGILSESDIRELEISCKL